MPDELEFKRETLCTLMTVTFFLECSLKLIAFGWRVT